MDLMAKNGEWVQARYRIESLWPVLDAGYGMQYAAAAAAAGSAQKVLSRPLPSPRDDAVWKLLRSLYLAGRAYRCMDGRSWRSAAQLGCCR